MTYPISRDYLACPDCRKRRVTFRYMSDGDGFSCDRCGFTAYIHSDTFDQMRLRRLLELNPEAPNHLKERMSR